ncbi:fructose-6-phosphate aldolase, partial [candidate division KSB1 bacterium]
MKFFIDSANISDIKKAVALGLCDGVTTNPTLLAKESGSAPDIYKSICAIVDGPVNAETTSVETEDIVREGRALAAIHSNIVVKIPCTQQGLVAVKQLEDEGIRTNVTLIFSPVQALLAAKAGASFVCPFVGRLDDAGHDGMEVVEQILSIFENYGIACEIIVAS